MDLELNNRLALVTGSTQGIGRAIGQGRGVRAGLATAAGAQQVRDAVAGIGPVDILVNNVGYFEVKPFREITDRDWRDMFELNVMGGVRLTRGLFEGMLTRN